MNKIVALVRVSTDKQDVNNQKFAIEKKYPGYDIVWFEEPGISGAKKFRNRPELQAAIRLAKKSDCPLVVYSLSRLGRTYEVGQFLEDNKGKIKLDVAVDKIKNVDNFEMIVEEHNIEDGLFYAKEDYWKKANAEGRSQ